MIDVGMRDDCVCDGWGFVGVLGRRRWGQSVVKE